MRVEEIVLHIRKVTGLSQQKFSDEFGLHRSNVSQFENSIRRPLPHHAKKYLVVSKQFDLGYILDDFYSSVL